MRFCSYIMRVDSGFAPNPFYGYCTLAACTPNHSGVKLSKGDWIMGTEDINRGNKLIYAMEVDEVLNFNKYFNDKRFEAKKPTATGSWRSTCGDNIYYKDHHDQWTRVRSPHHNTEELFYKDTKNPFVFISKHFYYFGENAKIIESAYSSLIWTRQGCKCDHNLDVVRAFCDWLKANYRPGIHGIPIDRDKRNSEVKLCD